MKFAPTFLVALSAAALAVPAQANSTAGSTQSAEQPAKKEKTICKRETSVGSNIPAKVCKTESEWKAELDRARDRFQDRDKD